MSAFGDVISNAHGRPVQRITCSGCGATEDIAAHNSRLPPHSLAGKFRKRGWDTDGASHHTCPGCKRLRRAERQERRTMAAAAKPIQPGDKSEAARLATQACFLELMDHYDMAARAYRGDMTDAKIAEKCGLSVAAVTAKREADFGPLTPPRPDPMIAAKASIAAAEKSIDEAGRALGSAVQLLIRAHDQTKAALAAAVPGGGT